MTRVPQRLLGGGTPSPRPVPAEDARQAAPQETGLPAGMASGRFCCLAMLGGAAPTDSAKYEPDHRRSAASGGGRAGELLAEPSGDTPDRPGPGWWRQAPIDSPFISSAASLLGIALHWIARTQEGPVLALQLPGPGVAACRATSGVTTARQQRRCGGRWYRTCRLLVGGRRETGAAFPLGIWLSNTRSRRVGLT
jgi:hypothetical protein